MSQFQTVYHLTSSDNVENVMSEGLKLNRGKIYVTTDLKAAQILSLANAYDGIRPDAENYSILKIKLPKSVNLLPDTMWENFLKNDTNKKSGELMRVVREVMILENVDLHTLFFIKEPVNVKYIKDLGWPNEVNLLKYYKKIRKVEI